MGGGTVAGPPANASPHNARKKRCVCAQNYKEGLYGEAREMESFDAPQCVHLLAAQNKVWITFMDNSESAPKPPLNPHLQHQTVTRNVKSELLCEGGKRETAMQKRGK